MKIQNKSPQTSVTLVYALFLAWLLSFLWQVPTVEVQQQLIFAYGLGLFASGLLARKQPPTKGKLLFLVVSCIVLSLASIFGAVGPPSLVSFLLAGIFMGWWGFYLKREIPFKQGFNTAVKVLFYSHLPLGITNLLAISSAPLSLACSIGFLLAALLFLLRLRPGPLQQEGKAAFRELSGVLMWLFAFVLIGSINVGLVYLVVRPAFGQIKMLAGFYGGLSYLLALLILRALPDKVNRTYLLYNAMSTVGIAFLLLICLDRSPVSYLVIDALLMGALGAFDLFLLSILLSLLDYTDNPALLFGSALAMNALGIWLGGVTGKLLLHSSSFSLIPAVGLVLVFAAIVIFPPLNIKLKRLLKQHPFLTKIHWQDKAPFEFKGKKLLTEKELKIVELLVSGYTYKAIARTLFISENTLKYHIKNIYQKLKINSKMELIKLLPS